MIVVKIGDFGINDRRSHLNDESMKRDDRKQYDMT